jgi:uncharacterized protein YegP (UPF0339 family)
MSGYYDLYKSTNQQHYFNLTGGNNEKILTSELYHQKQSALDGIASMRINAPHDSRYKRKTSTRGFSYFVLTAANGEPIGTSEEYTSSSAMEHSIAVVKQIAPTAILRDHT